MMKKRLIGTLLAGMIGLSSAVIPAITTYADGTKVVTLGADLTQQQKDAILRYFGVYGDSSVQVLTVTNQDERNHLGAYVPIEQIGNRTISCALVNPTASGGIQVKTANLDWVTSNMIATTLSTSGISNCEVLAAAPFVVSGTGALTGIMMAYESATSQALDQSKKDIATQELVTTGNIAQQIGQQLATNIVNTIKQEIIANQVTDSDQVNQIVQDTVNDSQVQLSQEELDQLDELANQIANEQYDYEDMRETLDRVEANLNTDGQETVATEAAAEDSADSSSDVSVLDQAIDLLNGGSSDAETPETLAEDSILTKTDDQALADLNGGQLLESATNDAAISDEATTVETLATENMDSLDTSIDVAGDSEDGSADIADADASVDSSDPLLLEAITENGSSYAIKAPNSADDGTLPAGSSVIRVFLPYDSLVPVSGILTVSDSTGTVVASMNISNPAVDSSQQQIIYRPMSDKNLSAYGWGTGTAYDFILPDLYMMAGETYTASLTYGVFAQTSDPTATDGAYYVTTEINNVTLGDVSPQGYGLDIQMSSKTDLESGGILSGTVLFPDDGSSSYATVQVNDTSKAEVDSIAVQDGLIEPAADGVSAAVDAYQNADIDINLFASGNVKVNVQFYTDADSAANGESPLYSISYFLPIQ